MNPKVVSVKQMQTIEAAADKAGISYQMMMETAGLAAADHIIQQLLLYNLEPSVLFLIGPGNNGGDGLIAATGVASTFMDATINIYMLKRRDDEAFQMIEDFQNIEVFYADEDEDLELLQFDLVDESSIIVDALLGTGLKLPLKKNVQAVLQAVKGVFDSLVEFGHDIQSLTIPMPALTPPIVIALDCPTGLDCDTGEASEYTLRAHSTITFGAVKHGLLKFPGADYVGNLVVGDIGLEDEASPRIREYHNRNRITI